MSERLLNAAARFYVVQPGDTLHAVGRRLGRPWRSLDAVNPATGRKRNPHVIFPGDLVMEPVA